MSIFENENPVQNFINSKQPLWLKIILGVILFVIIRKFLPFFLLGGICYLLFKKIPYLEASLKTIVIFSALISSFIFQNKWNKVLSSSKNTTEIGSSLSIHQTQTEPTQKEEQPDFTPQTTIKQPTLNPSATKEPSLIPTTQPTQSPTATPTSTPTNTPTPTPQPENTFKVTKVVDGDTIEIETGERVRYIGIDTPEVYGGKECFGEEASTKNKELVLNKTVRLEKDISETDRYDRLLRYIWLGNELINETLVKEGYALASSYPPDVKYQSRFQSAQNEAQAKNRGLWSACSTPTTTPTATTTPTPKPTNSPIPKPTNTPIPPTPIPSTFSCDCSHNIYNCSDFSPYEAQLCFEYCGGVSNDIHDLDRDGDGNACEWGT